MLIIPAPEYRRRRDRPRRRPPVGALALVAVEVDFFDGADGEVRLFFNTSADNPLADITAAAPVKWTARFGGVAYTGDTLSRVAFNRIDLHLLGGAADAGPDVINYSNAPSDIADAQGRQLAAFEAFPLGV